MCLPVRLSCHFRRGGGCASPAGTAKLRVRTLRAAIVPDMRNGNFGCGELGGSGSKDKVFQALPVPGIQPYGAHDALPP